MATNNRRVAAYFPSEVDEAFKDFKIQNGFATEENPSQNDSKALIHILSQFLKVENSVAHTVSLLDNLVTIEQVDALRQEFESRLSELLGNSQKLTQRIETLEAKWDTSIPPEEYQEDQFQYEGRKSELPSIPYPEPIEASTLGPDVKLQADEILTTVKLAKRLNISSSTLSHWKKDKSPEQLTRDIQKKDPDGVGWILDITTNKFSPAKDVPGSSRSTPQGELLA